VAATVQNPTPRTLIDDQDNKRAVQALAGLAARFGGRADAFVQYRALTAGRVDGRDTRGQRFEYDLSTQALQAGVRFRF